MFDGDAKVRDEDENALPTAAGTPARKPPPAPTSAETPDREILQEEESP
jgi:hypothetical protein